MGRHLLLEGMWKEDEVTNLRNGRIVCVADKGRGGGGSGREHEGERERPRSGGGGEGWEKVMSELGCSVRRREYSLAS